ncbi:MAG: ABC transporter substrate-binding protein [Amaricoccus sp.]
MTLYRLPRRSFIKSSLVLGTAMALGPRTLFAQEAPKSGGNLRLALLGGGPTESLDAHTPTTAPDGLRGPALYDALFTLDNGGNIVPALAESIEADPTASIWTIRLREALFHDGRPVTANDVIATFRRIADPDSPKYGAAGLEPFDMTSFEVLDPRTLRFKTKVPFSAMTEVLSFYPNYSIVPADYDPAKPIGSGPFKVESFTPGDQSVFSRFDDYYLGKPYLDSLTVTTRFSDANAAYNALQSGEIDVFSYAPLNLAKRVEAAGGGPIKALVSNPGQWVPFSMAVDTAPFDNVDVRTAFKLMIDRQQMINVALNGYGQVANDVFSPHDVDFDDSLVRPHDPDQAKALLKKAGYENLSVELVTADIATGAVQSAQVLAQQAAKIGVTVKVNRVPTDTFWSQNYLKSAFSQNFWGYSPYVAQVSQCMIKGAPYNETHWEDEAYRKLYDEVQSTLDPARRSEIVRAMQKIDFEQDGYIIPSFNVIADLMRENVMGFEKSSNGYPLGTMMFAKAWLA